MWPPASANAIGNMPPAVIPASTRKAISVSKFVIIPQASVVMPPMSMHTAISRALLNMSASAPSTG